MALEPTFSAAGAELFARHQREKLGVASGRRRSDFSNLSLVAVRIRIIFVNNR